MKIPSVRELMYTGGALIGGMYGVRESRRCGTLKAPVVGVTLMRSLHGSVEIGARPREAGWPGRRAVI
jgi:hypothetical protein